LEGLESDGDDREERARRVLGISNVSWSQLECLAAAAIDLDADEIARIAAP
jgi:hypothetical protein